MVLAACDRPVQIAALWWHGCSRRSLPGRKQKKGNKEGLGEKGKEAGGN